MTIPVVPLEAFRSLTGDELAPRLDELLAVAAHTEVVLFSDVPGEQLALVAVGPGKRFAKLAEAAAVEIDGLRALCAVRVADASTPPVSETERAHELEELAKSLEARERFVAECEQRLTEVGQTLSEREARVEQREHMLREREREFAKRSGEPLPEYLMAAERAERAEAEANA